ncbi:MAG: (2Fe-2S)-binding protein [Lachnospiraceae bacterium]|jgi:aerobic-type carbon monoxide dehydrogenase small subunit (CoxS/CutS family)|nr:(2Fe-2S)-binding protein [Lachnospiraceae bacterium]
MAQFSRRDFLKAGSAGIAGVALSSLGLGSILGTDTAGAAESVKTVVPVETFVYVCPVCGEKAADFDALVSHFQTSHPEQALPAGITLNINNREYPVFVEDQWTLRETIQRAIGLGGGAKEMCDRGGCGSCTVLIDGRPALACTTLAVECVGKKIETSEGIAADPAYRPLVEAYVRNDTSQCGYCTPGMLTVAKYILTKYPEPTEEQIRLEMSGNICRCGTYKRHVKAIQEAAAAMKGGN